MAIDTPENQDGSNPNNALPPAESAVADYVPLFARADAMQLAANSKHIIGLAKTQTALKRELETHETALMPIVEAIITLDNETKETTHEIAEKQSKLTKDQKDVAIHNRINKSTIESYEAKAARYKRRLGDNSFFGVLEYILIQTAEELLDDRGNGNEGTHEAIGRMERRVEELKGQFKNTDTQEKELLELADKLNVSSREHKRQIGKKFEVEDKKTYDVFTQIVLNEQAVLTSLVLAQYAANSGTTLDAVLENMGDLAKPFAEGRLTKASLDAAVKWAKSNDKNVDLSPEQLAFKQYVNRMVIPNIGSFEAFSAMVDDLNTIGVKTRQPLALLKQKPIELAGKQYEKPLKPEEIAEKIAVLEVTKADAILKSDDEGAVQLGQKLEALKEQQKKIQIASSGKTKSSKEAAEALAGSLPAVRINSILRSKNPIATQISEAIGENEKALQDFEGLFAGIEEKIDHLVSTAQGKIAEGQAAARKIHDGRIKNERLEERIGEAEFLEKKRAELAPKMMPRGLRILDESLRHGLEGGLAGTVAAGFAAGGAKAAVGAIGAGTAGAGAAAAAPIIIGGLALGLLWGGIKGNSASKLAKAEVAIRKELVGYLQSQKVDIAKHEAEIETIVSELIGLADQKKFQEEVGTELRAIRVRNAYIARSLLRSGAHNATLLNEMCEQHGVKSLDEFVSGFGGEVRVTLKRFCFGLANSNDMSLILADSDALTGSDLKPHERVLKDFVETVMKPDIGGYLSKASKVDVISQSNLLPYGAPLDWTKGIVRDENSPALAALTANEFGMSVVGLQDVKHAFDFYLHRHGDKHLHDAKLKDGQMTDESVPKRVNVYQPDEIDLFVNRTKTYMTHGGKNIPTVSDLFLRVSAYEYFMPQAVRTAGTNNIFAENPEAPAAYPMINATVNAFIEKMSLGPIAKFRQVVGERADNVIAQTFIDYFAMLGVMHLEI